jgi:hypothetical protein
MHGDRVRMSRRFPPPGRSMTRTENYHVPQLSISYHRYGARYRAFWNIPIFLSRRSIGSNQRTGGGILVATVAMVSSPPFPAAPTLAYHNFRMMQ